ncbi:acyl carrier protein [Streptacidiphilus albus]|uniref:acyl carrier protein n=1 Tax=Streptacidiphilus albus TaxID=105425 RepID=UPI00054BD798|nr:phosphopantetheine-binding protein [Streptacidiphilus albus]
MNSEESILELLQRALVGKFQNPPESVGADAAMTDLLIDSLMIVEMAITIHDDFAVTVGDDELRRGTLGELAARINERKEAP